MTDEQQPEQGGLSPEDVIAEIREKFGEAMMTAEQNASAVRQACETVEGTITDGNVPALAVMASELVERASDLAKHVRLAAALLRQLPVGEER